MHPLRTLLIVSLAIAAGIAAVFTTLLVRVGVSRVEAVVLGLVVFGAYLVPWGGTFLWAYRRASDLDALIAGTRGLVEHDVVDTITDRTYHGELDELARVIDALRTLLIEQRASMIEHRGAVDQIVGALGEGLMAVSATRRVVFANSKLAEMFGSAAPLAGRSFLEVVRMRAVSEAIEGALQGRATVTRVDVNHGGHERQIEIRAVPVTSSREIAAVALFIDVSNLDRLQRIRRDFLDDFSHEIRTPLAGLRTAAETLGDRRIGPADEEALRQVVLRQTQRIERLIRDISELNRIESGDLVLERQRIDLHELVADLATEFGAPAVRGEAAWVDADPLRLQQVFSNLIDNARKYGGEGVEIEVSADDEWAAVRVLDRGPGIPPGDIERIFNRFYRVDRSRSQGVPGLGLGLAIAKHLVLLHGGSIQASNRPGGGTSFDVRLPSS